MIHFCTFGNDPDYSNSKMLLCKEAQLSGYFNTIKSYNQDIIPTIHKEFVKKNRRGYGYWLWKPLVILNRMNDTSDGDIIIYADAGCGISIKDEARVKFKEWIQHVNEHPTHRISFRMHHKEEHYTKADVFKYMNCDADEYKQTGQGIGGIQIYVNNTENKLFLNELLHHMTVENYHYLTDSPSKISNSPGFIDHRHDQSLLSLMMKKYGSHVYADHWKDDRFPITALRRRK
jgi:hypothetical protein